MFRKKHSSFICSSNYPHPPNKAVPLCVLECCAVLCLVTQLCPTCCDPIDSRSQAPLSMGTLHARILEWVAMPSSRGSSQPRN